jgi:hypothetical protein
MIKLKVINEARGANPFVTIQDSANKEHLFEWDEAVGAFCKIIETQEDVDNLYQMQAWPKVFYRLGVVMTGGGPVAGKAKTPVYPVSKIPPYVKPELYENYPLADLLMLCSDCGFTPEGDATQPENIKRQLRRYYEGRAWAQEEMKRLRLEVESLRAARAAASPAKPASKRRATVAAPVLEVA